MSFNISTKFSRIVLWWLSFIEHLSHLNSTSDREKGLDRSHSDRVSTRGGCASLLSRINPKSPSWFIINEHEFIKLTSYLFDVSMFTIEGLSSGIAR